MEANRTRAQYLNGLALAVVSITGSAILAGAPTWVLLPAGVASGVLHITAVHVSGR
jgi:hypothetical protein